MIRILLKWLSPLFHRSVKTEIGEAPTLFILWNDQPMPCSNARHWAIWMALAKRGVAHTVVGETTILTEFVGHTVRTRGMPPRLFETRSYTDLTSVRYRRVGTRAEAQQIHDVAVAEARVWQAAAERVTRNLGVL